MDRLCDPNSYSLWAERDKHTNTILSGKDMSKMQSYLNRVARKASLKSEFFLPSMGRRPLEGFEQWIRTI